MVLKRIDIFAGSGSKKKNKGLVELENGHLFIYSRVENNKRAAAGVGCLNHQKLTYRMNKWEAYSERILTVEMKKIDESVMTIISVYGPDDEKV